MSSGGFVASWVTAGATFAAVLAALFKEDFRKLWRRAALEVSVKLEAPHCHKTTIQSIVSTGQFIGQWPCYYFRIWVKNSGNLRAEKVQVFASKLLRKHADGSFQEEVRFLPMNLRWSNPQFPFAPVEIFADGISPGMGKHCDFFHISIPAMRNGGFAPTLPNVPQTDTIAELDLEVSPNNLGHLVPPGVYRVELLIAAANARPVSKTLEINLTGRWFDDQAQMFADGIGLRGI